MTFENMNNWRRHVQYLHTSCSPIRKRLSNSHIFQLLSDGDENVVEFEKSRMFFAFVVSHAFWAKTKTEGQVRSWTMVTINSLIEPDSKNEMTKIFIIIACA